MTEPERLLSVIHSTLPDLAVESVVYHGQGQNNQIMLVNGSLIFRFPRYPVALEKLRIETSILNAIHDRVPLAVPKPLLAWLNAPVGEAFVSYERIPGEPLTRSWLNEITSYDVLEHIARQLGEFLLALHRLPLDQVKFPLPHSNPKIEYLDQYQRVREKLFPVMRPEGRERVEHHYESFFNDPANFEIQPVLIHGDFGASNILFDPERQALTGIIDFGGAGLGDPAVDFAGLLACYGMGFLHRLSTVYPQLIHMEKRIRFYQGTFALEEALFGLEQGDLEAYQSGMASYV